MPNVRILNVYFLITTNIQSIIIIFFSNSNWKMLKCKYGKTMSYDKHVTQLFCFFFFLLNETMKTKRANPFCMCRFRSNALCRKERTIVILMVKMSNLMSSSGSSRSKLSYILLYDQKQLISIFLSTVEPFFFLLPPNGENETIVFGHIQIEEYIIENQFLSEKLTNQRIS